MEGQYRSFTWHLAVIFMADSCHCVSLGGIISFLVRGKVEIFECAPILAGVRPGVAWRSEKILPDLDNEQRNIIEAGTKGTLALSPLITVFFKR